MKQTGKSFIVLFSEMLWIYYTFVLFLGIERNEPLFFSVQWFVFACIFGYLLNTFLAGRVAVVLIGVSNALVLGTLIYFNWRSVVTTGEWTFGILLTIALSFLFLRGLNCISREPSRQVLVRRFEGNIVLYLIFASIFTLKEWINETLHFSFIAMIIFSLLGIILSIQQNNDGTEKVEIRKIGQATWFTGFLSVFIFLIPLLSFALLFSNVNQTLYMLVIKAWEGLKWLAVALGHLIAYLMSFFPQTDTGGPLPEMENGMSGITPGESEEFFFTIPFIWLLAPLAFLLIIVTLWILSKLVKQRRTLNAIKIKKVNITKEQWWRLIARTLKDFIVTINKKWRMRFPVYYKRPIYWYFYQLQKWGEKNGIKRSSKETSKDYVERMIKLLEVEQSNDALNLANGLRDLDEVYQAAYYGSIAPIEDGRFKELIKKLHKIKLSKKALRKEEMKADNENT